MNWSLILFLFILASGCSGKKSSASATNNEDSEDLVYGVPPTTTPGADPLISYQWHLSNTGQNAFAQNNGSSDEDLNLPSPLIQDGSGITVLVSDDSVEHFHDDLYANWSLANSKNFLNDDYSGTPAPGLRSDDYHGTSVAGIIGAIKNNSTGGYGVAPAVTLAGANTLSKGVSQVDAIFLAQANVDVSIVNMSWGTVQNEYSESISSYEAQLQHATSTFRSGRGTVFVKSAGNDFSVDTNNGTRVGNSNFDGDNTIPEIISVAAIDANGVSSSYSSPGSNIWISAPGGESGTTNPAIVTTDRLGCNYGLAKNGAARNFNTNADSTVNNDDCKYTSLFNGTSSAAPMISGAIALLLQKHPTLSWRQVKYILAKTARQIDAARTSVATPPNTSATLPTGLVWENAWLTNGAGFNFHNWYGFGAVDVTSMLNFDTATLPNLSTLLETTNAGDYKYIQNYSTPEPIPDNSNAGVDVNFNVTENFTIEEVLLKITLTHQDLEDVMIEVISPDNKKNIIFNAFSGMSGKTMMSSQKFLTNAFYGKNTTGTWHVKIYDVKSSNGGTVSSVKLKFRGH